MHLQYLRGLNYDIQAVELSVKDLRKAMLDGDSLALRNLTCEELTYGHSSGSIEDRETFINNLVSGKTDVVTLDIKDQDITVKGDVAWVRFIMNSNMVSNGTSTTLNLKVLLVWTKVNGLWKLIARQGVKY